MGDKIGTDADCKVPGKVPTLWVTDAPQQPSLSHAPGYLAFSPLFVAFGSQCVGAAGRIIELDCLETFSLVAPRWGRQFVRRTSPFMQDDPIYRLIHFVSPRVWLLVSMLSLLLAGASGWVLLSRSGENPKDGLYALYDGVVRFTHETIRLTFKTDKKQAAVFVAPIGILNQKSDFKWVQGYQDFKPLSEDGQAEPKAPARLLESDWQPAFSDAYGRKES
ncbi:MAG: hypothetical protein ACOYNZ_05715 [Rhodoferax sp.]